MKIIVCLDNSDGMLFNNRRQSKDKKVIEDIGKNIKENELLITSFSESLFENSGVNFKVVENFENANLDKYCFIENQHLKNLEEKISEVIVYKWNRNYPSDFKFDIDYKSDFKLQSSIELEGFSHEKITKEIYTK